MKRGTGSTRPGWLQHRLIDRRTFLAGGLASFAALLFGPVLRRSTAASPGQIFWITNIPDQPFQSPGHPNYHAGIESILHTMGRSGLKFYRSSATTITAGPSGLIDTTDVVLIKVNAQWKYRGCTNSDVIRGLVQRILDHPDGFTGEVVIFENGQGRGSLNCDTAAEYPDSRVHANANDESHSFEYLTGTIFRDARVSTFLLDPISATFIGPNDHTTNGYRLFENVSYPCFTTTGGRRVELKEGVWTGSGYGQNLKLINVPVLKHHDTGGSEITGAIKHVYGILSMSDGHVTERHYQGLGAACGKMFASIRPPVLNIMDAIWVSHLALTGYNETATKRLNQLMASQDPVALDYCAAKHCLYPVDGNTRHHPDFPGIAAWMNDAAATINDRGGLSTPDGSMQLSRVTKNEAEMSLVRRQCRMPYRFNLRTI